MMEKRNQLIMSIVLVLVIIIATIGITYAFFTLQIQGSPSDINISTGRFDINFATTKYISVINASLIDNANKQDQGSVSLFSVTLVESDLDTIDYYVNMEEIIMSVGLYSKYFHYELIKFNALYDDNYSSKSACNGAIGIYFWNEDETKCYELFEEPSNIIVSDTFAFCDSEDVLHDEIACNEFEESNRLRINNSAIRLTNDETHYLGVRLWLENDPDANTPTNNQNNLMNTHFATKISIVARQIHE